MNCTSATVCQSCIDGYYLQISSCVVCSSLCLTCDIIDTNCTSCDTGYILNGNTC